MQLGRINRHAVQALTRATEIDAAVKTAATRVRNDARRRAPFRTGHLRRSLTLVKVGDEYHVGWNPLIADYGRYVEFGTNDTPAEPHLLPALRALR